MGAACNFFFVKMRKFLSSDGKAAFGGWLLACFGSKSLEVGVCMGLHSVRNLTLVSVVEASLSLGILYINDSMTHGHSTLNYQGLYPTAPVDLLQHDPALKAWPFGADSPGCLVKGKKQLPTKEHLKHIPTKKSETPENLPLPKTLLIINNKPTTSNKQPPRNHQTIRPAGRIRSSGVAMAYAMIVKGYTQQKAESGWGWCELLVNTYMSNQLYLGSTK